MEWRIPVFGVAPLFYAPLYDYICKIKLTFAWAFLTKG